MRSHFRTRRVTTVIAAAAAALLGSTLLGTAPASAATNIVIGVNPASTNAMAQYAIDKGFYAKNGLSASLRLDPAPPQTLAALASGQVQFVYIPIASALPAYTNSGMALKIIAPADGFSRSDAARAKKDKKFAGILDPSGICANPASGIKTAKDLAGKVVGTSSRGGLAELGIVTATRNAGGDPKQIKFAVIGLPNAVASVKNRVVDAAYVGAPFTGQCIAEGLSVVASPGLSIIPNGGPAAAWVTTAAYAAANPAVVKAFQKSMYEANKSTLGNPAAKREVALAGTKITKSTAELALAEYPRYQFTSLTKLDVQQVADALQRAGLVVKPVDVAGILAPQYRP